jgi:hypothetical protein
MKREELIERGFGVDSNGKILDEYGNEYRNEEGQIEYIEGKPFGQGLCANCGSEDIDYQRSNLVDESIGYEYECNSCGHFGEEWYNLVYDVTD